MNKVIKIAVFGVALVLICGKAAAQNSEMFRYALAEPDSLNSAAVRVTEHGSASDAMRRYNEDNKAGKSIAGYRVRIFFARNQEARQDAIAVQQRFREQFPTIPTYLVYKDPSFMVTVGNCMNMEEALILLARVSANYPSAFLWTGNIPVSEFLREGDATENVDPEEGATVSPAAGSLF